VILGPFNVDRDHARRSFGLFAGIEADAVCFGHGNPLLGTETDALREAASNDTVPDPFG
jgi:hypothetical protein